MTFIWPSYVSVFKAFSWTLRFTAHGFRLYNSQQARKKLGLRRGRKERRLPQLLADADLKRFFRAIQDCGDLQHEIMLKLLFYTAIGVSGLVHIEVGDVDLDACKILINWGKGAKCGAPHFCPYVLVKFMFSCS